MASQEDTDRLLAEVMPPYYQIVGEIASIWAMVEQQLDRVAWDVGCIEHPLGACMTSQLNGPGPRIRLLRSLLDLRGWNNAVQVRLNKMSHEIQKAQESRNRAIHDVSLVGAQSKQVFRRRIATVDNKLVFEVSAQSVDELKSVRDNSLSILRKLNVLIDDIRTNVPSPSRDKLQQLRQRQGPPSENRLYLSRSQQKREDPLEELFDSLEAEQKL